MAEIEANAAIQSVANPQWRRARRRSAAAYPYLLVLVALCIASVAAALADPLAFAEIFGGF